MKLRCPLLALSGHDPSLHTSDFGGKADMTVCGSPLSRSLLGVKRTWLCATHMSAYDPKRTCQVSSGAVGALHPVFENPEVPVSVRAQQHSLSHAQPNRIRELQ